MKKRSRDLEKSYSKTEFVKKLHRLADSIQKGTSFRIAVGGEELFIPEKAVFTVEHERSGSEEELEFQMKWKRRAVAKKMAAPKKAVVKKVVKKKATKRKKK
jgi:amphi-Trp domain-containing protein